jgi:adenylate cyclase, class 2
MVHGGHETEIKLAVRDAQHGRDLLRKAGFRVARRRVFESNTVFDTPGLALRKTSRLLRVRVAGTAHTLTYKGPPAPGRHKGREELEVRIPRGGTVPAMLERLGYRPSFRYEKYRTEFMQAGSRGVATLDETPVGVYLELEGAPGWIDRTARKLGFAESAYITASYGRLYLDWCQERGVEPKDMVFG